MTLINWLVISPFLVLRALAIIAARDSQRTHDRLQARLREKRKRMAIVHKLAEHKRQTEASRELKSRYRDLSRRLKRIEDSVEAGTHSHC